MEQGVASAREARKRRLRTQGFFARGRRGPGSGGCPLAAQGCRMFGESVENVFLHTFCNSTILFMIFFFFLFSAATLGRSNKENEQKKANEETRTD